MSEKLLLEIERSYENAEYDFRKERPRYFEELEKKAIEAFDEKYNFCRSVFRGLKGPCNYVMQLTTEYLNSTTPVFGTHEYSFRTNPHGLFGAKKECSLEIPYEQRAAINSILKYTRSRGIPASVCWTIINPKNLEDTAKEPIWVATDFRWKIVDTRTYISKIVVPKDHIVWFGLWFQF